jgi:glycosyltransferase involved in cell wall biosynthesis
MAEYVKDSHDVPRVLDYMDALSAGIARQSNLAPPLLRWVYRLEFRRLRSYESTIFDYFDGRTIISEADRKLIQHTNNQLIDVIPNGIDAAFFNRRKTGIAPEKKSKTLLFTGNMSYPPNVDAAIQLVEQILPKLTTHDVHVVIAGTEPDVRVKQLVSDQVEVTGWIPDIRQAYAAADVFVAPLRIGTGQQNKILEAMSMELPCVTTQHVLRGFPMETNENPPMLVADSAERIAAEIDALLSDDERCLKTGQLSRVWVEKHCDWFQSAQKLEHTFVHSTVDQIEETVWNRTTSA